MVLFSSMMVVSTQFIAVRSKGFVNWFDQHHSRGVASSCRSSIPFDPHIGSLGVRGRPASLQVDRVIRRGRVAVKGSELVAGTSAAATAGVTAGGPPSPVQAGP